MREKLILIIKRAAATLCLFTGMLAMTNESLLRTNSNTKEAKLEQNRQAKERLLEKLKTPVATTKSQGQAKALRESLAQDEFTEGNPFASLADIEPINAVFAKGVKNFERTTYRSPDHQSESGYDLLQYEVEHPHGGKSIIVAYLERPLLTASRNVGTLDERIPFVVVMSHEGEQAVYSYYRSGNLIEQNKISWTEAQSLVAQRVNASVPFLSVSR